MSTESESKKAFQFRVATYNVLTQPFIAKKPEELPHLVKAENVDANTRYTRIENQLIEEIGKKSLICLQEVSRTHAARLTTFFYKHGYYFITSNYGHWASDYFGVATAFPIGDYSLDDVTITKISDTKRWPKDDVKELHSLHRLKNLATAALGTAVSWIRWGLRIDPPQPQIITHRGVPPPPLIDAMRRENTVIQLNLTHIESKKALSLANYHMPCAYYSHAVMNTHMALLAQYTTRFAGNVDERPLIVAGDFNAEPGGPPYRLMLGQTKYAAGVAHPELIKLSEKDRWHPHIPRPFSSAYLSVTGSEPEFTNFNASLGEPPSYVYIGTLDYVFFTGSKLRCTRVKELPSLASCRSCGPFPNETEPSDHILIAAEFAMD